MFFNKFSIFCVVPTGEVDSKIIKLPFLIKGDIDSAASSTKAMSGDGQLLISSFLKGVGTQIINISAKLGSK